MTSIPRLVHHVDLPLPRVAGALEGLRIAHLTDIHIRRDKARHGEIIDALAYARPDLVFLTGDYMSWPGDEPASAKVLAKIINLAHARLGVYGVFGNHDTPDLHKRCADLPIRWLDDEGSVLAGHDIEIMGLNMHHRREPDSVAALLSREAHHIPQPGQHRKRLLLMLAHLPNYLPIAADLGVDIMFAGHTHGGQWRLPGARALVNSTDLPLHLTSGVLRHRDTLAVVSRGLGEVRFDIRFFCPPHLPIYTLRRGPMLGEHTQEIVNLVRW